MSEQEREKRLSIQTFTGSDTNPADAAAQAQREANALLANNALTWKHVKSVTVNVYPDHESANWHYYILTLVLEVPESIAVDLMW